MRAKISIVIPTLNSQKTIKKTFVSLLEGIEAGLIRELIIVDGGSTDKTKEIVVGYGGKFISCKESRGLQICIGVKLAKGDFVFILHSDSVLPADWSKKILKFLNREVGYYCKLSFDSKHPLAYLTSNWANARSRIFNLPYGDQGLLLARQLLIENGNYSSIPIMEDVDLAMRLKGRLFGMPIAITTSSEKYQKVGWLRQGRRNIFRLARFLLGADPTSLKDNYY